MNEISLLRLYKQQILNSSLKRPEEVVRYMGAMQAQDYRMAKWAIGARLPGSSEGSIVDAIANASIIRTHLMRPTWHFVSSDDIYWILDLTAPRIRSQLKGRHRNLGLSPSIIKKSEDIIIKELEGGRNRTRDELASSLEAAGIESRPSDNRLAHILLNAELDKIICNGPDRGNKITYALLEERVPKKNLLNINESLAHLARTYFASHGPATERDFSWWSGLTLTDCRKVLNLIKNDFEEIQVGGQSYFYKKREFKADKNEEVSLLPAYDEFLISYADRSASLPSNYNKKTVSVNGIFYPIIVHKGQVIGTWKIITKKEMFILEISYYGSQLPPKSILKATEIQAQKVGKFYNREIQVKFGLM